AACPLATRGVVRPQEAVLPRPSLTVPAVAARLMAQVAVGAIAQASFFTATREHAPTGTTP
ncbi:MAG: hypothetical protein WCP68_08510, partial [Enhydrobacter sp.]